MRSIPRRGSSRWRATGAAVAKGGQPRSRRQRRRRCIRSCAPLARSAFTLQGSRRCRSHPCGGRPPLPPRRRARRQSKRGTGPPTPIPRPLRELVRRRQRGRATSIVTTFSPSTGSGVARARWYRKRCTSPRSRSLRSRWCGSFTTRSDASSSASSTRFAAPR